MRTDRIGDVILTTPSFKALRIAFPKARITVLVAPLTKDLIVGNPYIDDIMVDDRLGEHKGVIGTMRLVMSLRKRGFDLAINYHTKKRTNALLFMAGISVRLGYKSNKFGFLLNKSVFDERHLGKKHESEYCLALLEVIGVKAQGLDLYVNVDKEANDWGAKFLKQNYITSDESLVVIHCGASDCNKIWSLKNFGSLIDILMEEYEAKSYFSWECGDA